MKTLITLIYLLVTTTAFSATDRVGDLVADDSYERLQKIKDIKDDLNKKNIALTNIENELSTQIKKSDRQGTAKVILKTAVVEVAAAALCLGGAYILDKNLSYGMLSTYKDMCLIPVLGIGVIAPVTVVIGGGMYFLNQNEAAAVAEKVRVAKVDIQKVQSNLQREIIQLCKVDSRHELCY